jgi:uncharacterized protein YndB with AHSA1/START domain
MARKTTYRSRIQRTIDAPAMKAFDAWADASTNAKWYSTKASHDVKVGGAYSNASGDKGQFLEIAKGKKLRYTWENDKNSPGTVVTVNFRPFGRNKCKVQVTHSKLAKKTDVEKFQDYWNWATDSLKSFIDSGRRLSMDAWQKQQAAEAKKATAKPAAKKPAAKKAAAKKPAAKKAAAKKPVVKKAAVKKVAAKPAAKKVAVKKVAAKKPAVRKAAAKPAAKKAAAKPAAAKKAVAKKPAVKKAAVKKVAAKKPAVKKAAAKPAVKTVAAKPAAKKVAAKPAAKKVAAKPAAKKAAAKPAAKKAAPARKTITAKKK